MGETERKSQQLHRAMKVIFRKAEEVCPLA